ncbi:MAG: hypothetical protein RLZZ53_1874 [Acidobacteriota bacterium]
MCGLAGFVNLDGAPADHAVLSAMMRLVAHRGPDDRGTRMFSLRSHDAPDSAFGFHRLAILDLSQQGHQPMANADGSVILVYNGEVYNAFDHKPLLEAAGYRFRSRSDAEVLLYLYEHVGLDGMLERLNGMFALAIADLRHRQVHLVRDHFGIKPLYWTQVGESVLFASEAKAFLAHPAFTPEVAGAFVDEQLAFRYVAGDATLMKGVKQLRPGHRLTIAGGGVATARYWSIPDVPAAPPTRAGEVDELHALLQTSVRSQLVGDVPVGCQLSGGVDSSLVTAFARAEGAAQNVFSVVFDDPKFSEAPWIEAAASITGAESHAGLFTAESFLDPLEDATWHMDQPISVPNSLGIWQLARHARPYATVLLSGEGADEVFAGYSRFQNASQLTADAFVLTTLFQRPSKLARLRPESNLPAVIERRAALFGEGQGDPLGRCVKYEMQTFLVDVLMRQDKMTMAHAVENRVPFLDRRVVEFARTLGAESLVGPGGAKAIVKAVARRFFSDGFVDRPKAAFNLPLSQYFRSARFTALMEDQVLPGIRQRSLVSEPAVRALWKRALAAPAVTEVFWIPVALELWAQQFLDGRRVRTPATTA